MSVQQENIKSSEEIYKKISKFVPDVEWKIHQPLIEKINKLKKEKNAIILAHNYQTPEIYHGVADIAADSLALAVEASKTTADKIIMCGVHFMAETAKLMSPNKKVFLPDMKAGCSLSTSITGEDVRMLKQKYPGVPVVSYVNTSADVKAETDVCCTSANAVKVVESLNVDRVIFLPDQYLADYVSKNTKVKIISWKGTCVVHEQFSAKEIEDIKKQNPGIKVCLHDYTHCRFKQFKLIESRTQIHNAYKKYQTETNKNKQLDSGELLLCLADKFQTSEEYSLLKTFF